MLLPKDVDEHNIVLCVSWYLKCLHYQL